jgi:protein TonB
MYRPVPTFRERAGPLGAVILVHAAIGYALLNLTSTGREIAERADVAIFDVILPTPPVEPPPPPPPPTIAEQRQPAKAKPEEEGAAAPENIRSKPTPVVAPPPRIVLPAPSPVVAAIKPGEGAGATQGAGDTPGPGTGAGGTGNGTGSGGSGTGGGGGGARGGTPTRPLVVESTKLTSRDYPPAAIRAWPRGGRVFVAIRVQLDGRATDCKINRSSGNPGVDADTCRLVMERVRFVPARDDRGRPYVDWYGYVQEPSGRW